MFTLLVISNDWLSVWLAVSAEEKEEVYFFWLASLECVHETT